MAWDAVRARNHAKKIKANNQPSWPNKLGQRRIYYMALTLVYYFTVWNWDHFLPGMIQRYSGQPQERWLNLTSINSQSQGRIWFISSRASHSMGFNHNLVCVFMELRSRLTRVNLLVYVAKRLALCEEVCHSKCGDVLFHGYLNPPGKGYSRHPCKLTLADNLYLFFGSLQGS